MRLKIDTYLPFKKESSEMDSLINELVSELLESSNKLELPLDDFGSANLLIELVTEDKISNLRTEYPTYFKNEILSILHFQSIIDYEEVYTFNLTNFPDYITNEILNESNLVGIYRSRFLNFLYFTQLSIPGSLYTDKGIFLTNDKFHMDFNSLCSSLVGIAYEDSPLWPYVKKVNIENVWNYITQKTNILFEKSVTNIEHGLNAITYLSDNDSSSANNLLWAMTGIEALYADGEIGIGFQIDRKSKLFLGEPAENKKIITKLYDYRSKFLHGKKSIPINDGWLGENETDDHEDELSAQALLSAKLLIATLQEIIAKNMIKFDFEFQLIK
jgi:hypothetical protein